MPHELAGSAILAAVKHRANHKPIIFCSLSLVAMGILMTIFGAIVLLLDHTELGPPVYDSQYERYAGSSLAHILGPLFIAFGSLIIMGNLFMLAYASRAYYLNGSSSSSSNKEGAPLSRQELLQVDSKRTNRQQQQQHREHEGLRMI